MQQLFTAIRESSTPSMWSKGIELSRQGGVQGEKTSSREEIVLRVMQRERTVCPVVTLWPLEEDWNCDCGGAEDPCEHVIAAVIAVKRASESGQDLPRAELQAARMGYRFKREKGALAFFRVLVEDGKELPLSVSLAALAAGRVRGPRVAPHKADLTIDVLLKDQREGVLPPRLLGTLLESLAACDDVTLDGSPITCSHERTGFIACLVDEGPGVRLFGKQAPEIRELFKNGAALCKAPAGQEAILKPINDAKLSPNELKLLASGQYFGQRELTALVSELLPALKLKLPVEYNARNLPRTAHLLPRLIWDSRKLGSRELLLSPRIVYGDPPVAALEHNQLVVWGEMTPMREIELERKLTEQLFNDYGISLDRELRLAGEDAVAMVERLRRSRQNLSGEGAAAFTLHAALDVTFTPRHEQGEADFDLLFSANDSTATGTSYTADPAVVFQHWREGGRLVPLLDGGWAPLPLDWLARYGHTLAELVEARQASGRLPRCLQPSLRSLCEDVVASRSDGAGDQLLRQFIASFPETREPQLPADLRADLRNYQREGVRWLTHLREQGIGALLADDMGLGKTLQAITILTGRCLVVAPTSVLYNWQQEIAKFRPGLRSHIYHGSDRRLDPEAAVTLTTYAILRLDLELLTSEEWDIVVLDEAQTIKNPASQVAQAAYQVSARFRLALSGTPIENKLDDVWSLFHFLNRQLLGTHQHFRTWYERPIMAGDNQAAQAFRRRLQPFILRRLKEDVAKELPPRTDMVLYCDLSEEEQRTYEAILLSTREEVIAKLQKGASVLQALEALLRLRQASCHTGLLPGQSAPSSSKVDLLLSCLEETLAGHHKALIFSQWTSFLDLMEGALTAAGIAFLRIDGSTVNRQDVVASFQNDKSYPVLLLSLKAAGVGLNLTAADHVYMMDPWWNPAVEDQAADRAHRIGQTKPVMVNKLVSRGTVEEKIIALQARKRELADTLTDGHGGIAALSRDELIDLLS